MSVSITFYKNASSPSKLDKALTLVGAISDAMWLDELDEEHPSIRVADTNAESYLSQSDYAQVEGKCYFVEPNYIKGVGNKFTVNLTFDPLTTYASAIKGLTGYMDRTTTGNPYIPDDQDETVIYRDQSLKWFNNGFDASQNGITFILTTSRKEDVGVH